MRAANSSFYSHRPSTNTQNRAYSPSVPLSVYRDLATELQAAQVRINALTEQNHQLAQENQFLRQEIAKTVQSVLHLQNLLDPSTQFNYQQFPQTQQVRTEPQNFPQSSDFLGTPVETNRQEVNNKRPVKKTQSQHKPSHPRSNVIYTEMKIPLSMPETVFVEEQEFIAYDPNEPEAEGINNRWLFLAILLIILFGFGAGYLVVRPFFGQQSR